MLVEIIGKQGEEQLVTSTLMVAEKFGKRHADVLETIDKMHSTEKSVQSLFFEDTYKDASGKKNRMFYMNRDGFSLLVMGFSGKDALHWKLEYIRAFNEMEKTLKRILDERTKWAMERAKSIYARHVLTDAIKDLVADTPNKKFAYPNYTKLIYKAIFNKTPKELREEHGLTKPTQSLRDCFTEEELNEIARLEGLVSGLLNYGWGYQQIKDFVMQNTNKRICA